MAPKLWYFVCNLTVIVRGKWHGKTHKWLLNAFGITCYLPFESEEDYETLHKQCMSLIAVEYHVYPTESVPQIPYFSAIW